MLAELRDREPIFRRPEFGSNPADLEQQMAPDFWEVGASGRRYSRDHLVAVLREWLAGGREDPWTTSGFYCCTQAWRVESPSMILFISGLVPLDDYGNLVAPDDFDGQVRRTYDNLGRVLDEAGGTFADMVNLTVYLTDMSRLPHYGRIKAEYIVGQQPASTAAGVPPYTPTASSTLSTYCHR